MKTLLPFAAFAALLPLVPVNGTTPPRTQVVSYRDLDLRSAAGAAKLDRRIHRAAQDVCGVASDFDLAGQRQLQRCQKATVANAFAQLVNKERTVQVAVIDR